MKKEGATPQHPPRGLDADVQTARCLELWSAVLDLAVRDAAFGFSPAGGAHALRRIKKYNDCGLVSPNARAAALSAQEELRGEGVAAICGAIGLDHEAFVRSALAVTEKAGDFFSAEITDAHVGVVG